MRAQLFLVGAAATSLASRAQTLIFWALGARGWAALPTQLLPCGPRAGAADVADERGQASGAGRIVNSAEHPHPWPFLAGSTATSRTPVPPPSVNLPQPPLAAPVHLRFSGSAPETTLSAPSRVAPACACLRGSVVTACACTRVDPTLGL